MKFFYYTQHWLKGLVGYGIKGYVIKGPAFFNTTFEAAKTVMSSVPMDGMSFLGGIYPSSPTCALIAVVFVGYMEARKFLKGSAGVAWCCSR